MLLEAGRQLLADLQVDTRDLTVSNELRSTMAPVGMMNRLIRLKSWFAAVEVSKVTSGPSGRLKLETTLPGLTKPERFATQASERRG